MTFFSKSQDMWIKYAGEGQREVLLTYLMIIWIANGVNIYIYILHGCVFNRRIILNALQTPTRRQSVTKYTKFAFMQNDIIHLPAQDKK
jgi:hypothetical protein